jgi:hypothetical protein
MSNGLPNSSSKNGGKTWVDFAAADGGTTKPSAVNDDDGILLGFPRRFINFIKKCSELKKLWKILIKIHFGKKFFFN